MEFEIENVKVGNKTHQLIYVECSLTFCRYDEITGVAVDSMHIYRRSKNKEIAILEKDYPEIWEAVLNKVNDEPVYQETLEYDLPTEEELKDIARESREDDRILFGGKR